MARKTLKIAIGISFLFVLAFSSFSMVAAKTRKVATLDFIAGCQVVPSANRLAYVDNPAVVETASPTMSSILGALRTLDLLDTFSSDLTGNFTNFDLYLDENFRNQSIGGFKDFTSGDETLKSTYLGLTFYSLFDEKDQIESIHLEFTNNSQNVNNSGFGANPSLNATPNLISTYYALQIYKIDGSLGYLNLSNVNDFIMSCQIKPGDTYEHLFGVGPNATEPNLIATSMAVALYKTILSAYDTITTSNVTFYNAVSSYLLEGRVAGGGIKDPVQSTDALLSTTYYGLMLSENMNGILQSYYESIESWIISKQQEDGGFVEGDPDESTATSSMEATFNAIASLKLMDSDLSAIDQEFPWELGQDTIIIIIVVLIIVIVVIVVIFYYYRKKNKI